MTFDSGVVCSWGWVRVLSYSGDSGFSVQDKVTPSGIVLLNVHPSSSQTQFKEVNFLTLPLVSCLFCHLDITLTPSGSRVKKSENMSTGGAVGERSPPAALNFHACVYVLYMYKPASRY